MAAEACELVCSSIIAVVQLSRFQWVSAMHDAGQTADLLFCLLHRAQDNRSAVCPASAALTHRGHTVSSNTTLQTVCTAVGLSDSAAAVARLVCTGT